jgi:Holliday junction DNA helicase RuvB
MIMALGTKGREARESAPATDAVPKRPAIGRPETIEEMVGQAAVIGRLRIVIEGAKARGVRVPNVLVSGPAGFGKTSLAHVIANTLEVPLIGTAGPILRKTGDLHGLLSSVRGKAVLFCDEIHRLPNEVSESLYQALEDDQLSILRGYGADARAITVDLPPITFVGATDRPGLLPKPLRDRFGFHAVMAPYSNEELATIVQRAFTRAGFPDATTGAALAVAERCRGVPRIGIHLGERVADVASLEAVPLDVELALRALAAFDVDAHGLGGDDYRLLNALVHTFGGRPVGMTSLMDCLDLDESTLREHESPLIRGGWMVRTRAGRMAMPKSHELIGPL